MTFTCFLSLSPPPLSVCLSLTDTKTVVVKPHIVDIGLNTCYSCKSTEVIEAEDKSVSQTLSNVTIQAFVANGTKSDKRKCIHAAAHLISPLQYQTNSSSFSSQSPFVPLTSPPQRRQLLPPPSAPPPPSARPPPCPHPTLETTTSRPA